LTAKPLVPKTVFLCAVASVVGRVSDVLRKQTVPAAQVAEERRGPVPRTLTRALDQQRGVEKHHG
jgi:hypothetical protein